MTGLDYYKVFMILPYWTGTVACEWEKMHIFGLGLRWLPGNFTVVTKLQEVTTTGQEIV